MFYNCSRSILFHPPPHLDQTFEMWRQVEEATSAAIGTYVHVILSKFNYPCYPHFIQNTSARPGFSICKSWVLVLKTE